jgi:C-terminal peptidase prc
MRMLLAAALSIAVCAAASGGTAVRPCEYIPGVTVPAVMPAAPSKEPSPGIGASAKPPVVTKVSGEKTASQLRILNGLSNAVRKDYIYTDFGVRDWNDVVESHKARISRGMSDDDFYAAMRSMVRALGDGHSFFETPDEVKKNKEEVAGQNKFVGVGAYISPIEGTDHATILSIYSDSPAAEAGFRPHDVILSVDGQSYFDEAGRPRTLGQPGTKVRLKTQRPGEPPRDVVLTRREVTGALPIDFCIVPTTRIGYISLPSLGDSTIADQVRGALQRMTADGPLQGLILDNRVNSGGLSRVMIAILSMFGSGVQGQFVSRTENTPLELKPEDIRGSQTVPLVVLIERRTSSNGEIMSGLLGLSARAKLVGSPTKGNVETLNWFQFEDGSRAWLAIKTFAPRGMKNGVWEGKGIAPDVFLPTRWHLFTEATDPGISKAVELLRK